MLSPFTAIILALGVSELWKWKKLAAIFILIPVIIFSLFFTINSNNLKIPVGSSKWYANFRLDNLGYNQVDKEISNMLWDHKPTPKIAYATTQWWYKDLQPNEIDFSEMKEGHQTFNSLIIIDSETTWFPVVWIKERWKLYHRFAIMTTNEFLQVISAEKGPETLNFLAFDKIYYFKSGPAVKNRADIKYDKTDPIYEALKKQNLSPKIIRDDQGREAFYLYQANRLDI